MCDCFHVVLPSWAGAPGSASGQHLQSEDPDPETEESSVTAGPGAEIIRPRPQGSSPVYECADEGASLGLLEDERGRPSSGSRRAWWKRDSGDSRTFSRMSRTEDCVEATLKTEVEAGASGYSVVGGGQQGLFVKQVLKGSTAAKLFSLQEGDQLLSATIFFDDIRYEDALKILQYSEPYKVQFCIRRKLPEAQCTQQEQDITEDLLDTPTRTLEGQGDQERLISKTQTGRGRRAQRERLSWPKFQSIKTKGHQGPRRSRSSSEAHEQAASRDVSPPSTDTESRQPNDTQETKGGPGSRRRKGCMNLRFRKLSGKGGKEAQEPESCRGGRESMVRVQVAQDALPDSERPSEPAQIMKGDSREAGQTVDRHARWGEHKHHVHNEPARGTKTGEKEQREGGGRQAERVEVQELELELAKLSLKDEPQEATTSMSRRATQLQFPKLHMPKFTFTTEHSDEKEGIMTKSKQEGKQKLVKREETKGNEISLTDKDEAVRDKKFKMPKFKMLSVGGSVAGKSTEASVEGDLDVSVPKVQVEKSMPSAKGDFGIQLPSVEANIKAGDVALQLPEGQMLEEMLPDVEGELKGHLPKVKTPSFKMSKVDFKAPQVDIKAPKIDVKGHKIDVSTTGMEVSLPSVDVDIGGPDATLEVDIGHGDKDVTSRDSKFKMPKFKMLSFGGSAAGKSMEDSLEGSLDITMPKVQVDVSMPSAQGNLKTADVRMQPPSVDVGIGAQNMASVQGGLDVSVNKVQVDGSMPFAQGDLKTADLRIQPSSVDVDATGGNVAIELPHGQVPEVALSDVEVGGGLKGHLPKVKTPSFKMPKVDFKAPKVDIKAPKIDVKGPKADVSTPRAEVSLPSVDIDIRSTDATLKVDIDHRDKDLASRDSKFKMPKFKMPSFGGSASGKSMDASMEGDLDVSVPKVQVDVSMPSAKGDPSIRPPSVDMDITAAHVAMQLPKGKAPEAALPDVEVGGGLKGHLPKVKTPSFKMPKVDFKAPEVDIKAPKIDVKCPKADMSTASAEVLQPSVDADIRVPDTKLEVDISHGDKDVTSRDSKFKFPKFKMPSIGGSAASKSIEASLEGDLDVSVPKVQVDVSMPSAQGDISIQPPSVNMDVKTGDMTVQLSEGQAPEAALPDIKVGGGLKGHLPKVKTPSFKMPKVDFKAPQVDIKAPKIDVKDPEADVSTPSTEVSLSSVDIEKQVPNAKLEVDISHGDKDVTLRDSKFKMPKFKMPSFGGTAAGMSMETSVEGDMDVSVPKFHMDVSRPSIQGELKTGDLTIQPPSVDVDVKTGDVTVQLPMGEAPEAALPDVEVGGGLKGHLPKVKTPSFKMPKVDLKSPQVDIKAPKIDVKGPKADVSTPRAEVSLPSMDIDIRSTDAMLKVDIDHRDKDLASRDSKFKMPKFKMPSFGGSASGKSMEASVEGDLDVSVPKVQVDVSMPSAKGDLSIQPPSVDMDITAGHVAMQLPEGQAPEAALPDVEVGGGLKGHLPKVKTPSFKMPKVDFKAPEVDIKAPKIDVKCPKADMSTASAEVSQPSEDADIRVPDTKLEVDISHGDKDVTSRDSKFKFPKFKMPSIGGSAASKSIEASLEGDLDVSVPKVQVDVSMPSAQGDISIQPPSVDVDVKTGVMTVQLSEGQAPEAALPDIKVGGGLKGHLPKVKTPSFKMPKVDFKAPQVEFKAPKIDVKDPKADVSTPSTEVTLPSVDVDIGVPDTKLEVDISHGDKDVTLRDSKFKMPKFKMPSFGGSAAVKSLEASVEGDMDVSVPKFHKDVYMPSIQGELKTGDLNIQPPSVDVDGKTGNMTVQLSEGPVPEPALSDVEVGGRLKGHLPKVKTPSFKMPKVEFKSPRVDIKAPKIDVKGPKADVSTPSSVVSLPSVDVDIPDPDATLKVDIGRGDKDLTSTDSMFKMPKFKMPSFGGWAAGKSMEASTEGDPDVSVPKVEVDVSMPSVKGDLSIQPPSVDMDIKTGNVTMQLPEGQAPEVALPDIEVGGGLKGNLPKVKTPSFKMPKVDFKAPQVDIKAPKIDVKGPKADVSTPSAEVSLPSVDVDIRVPNAMLEVDIDHWDKDVTSRDSKFKMPKFKMPSFSGSAAGKSIEASGEGDMDVSVPKNHMDVSMPSTQGELKTGDLTIQSPSLDMDIKTGDVTMELPEGPVPEPAFSDVKVGGGLKGNLPKVKTPSFKMPKVDFKAPQVDIKATKINVKGPKADVGAPSAEVSLPSVDIDIGAPDATLKVDIGHGDEDVTTSDSKFKMPKFKMPSFGGLAAGKSMEASVEGDPDVSMPKVQVDVSMSSAKGDLSIQSPSVNVDVKTGDMTVQLSEGQAPEVALPDVQVGGLKGHLPKVKIPSFKMPKIDFKAPQLDITAPKIEVKDPKADITTPSAEVLLSSVDVDIRVPDATLEVDIGHGDKDMTSRDSKFKMPKFKMPSFGGSAAGTSMEASVEGDMDVSVPKFHVDVSRPSIQGEVKTGDLNIQPPSVDVDIKTGDVTMQLSLGKVPEAALSDVEAGGGLKGHLPKVKTPSFKMPKLDLKSPQVDIKAPKIDVKGPKAEVSTPSAQVSLPSVDVDIGAPDATLEVDIGHDYKDVASSDSKFKMPKFKMPSFGGSAAGKSMETSIERDLDVSMPKVQVDVSMPSTLGDLSIQPPSVDVKTGDVTVQLPKGQVPEAALPDVEVGGGLKGYLPTVKTPSFKMPKVDLKAPQVDIKDPKIDVKGPKADMSIPGAEVSLPSVDVDIRVPDAMLEVDIGHGDKDVTSRDSKFKMPKFKMPSFGGLAAGTSIDASVEGDMDVSVPKFHVDVSMPSAQGELITGDLNIQLPSVDMDVKTGDVTMQLPEGPVPEPAFSDVEVGGGLKGHLPKVKTPSFKMPKLDLKASQVDIKAPKIDVKGPKADTSTSSSVVSLPSVDVDIPAPNTMLKVDIGHGDKDLTSRDSKFKMPKFKMPSFGGSAAGKSMETSSECNLDVSVPKVQVDVSMTSALGDLSIQPPCVDVDIKTGDVTVQPPNSQVPEPALSDVEVGGGLKGNLPKMKTPSFKIPKVDLSAPHVDIKDPRIEVKGPKAEVSTPSAEVSLPSMDVDIGAPDATLKVDISHGDKDMTSSDSKFKMPKFQMPSFSGSAAGKSIEASVEGDMNVSVPKFHVDVSMPSNQGELKTRDLNIQSPSVEVDIKTGDVTMQLPEGQAPDAALSDIEGLGGLKGHLPKVKTPSFKMPKVDFKAPQVDIKAPKIDVKGPKADVSTPNSVVSLPSLDVDIPAPDTTLKVDIGHGDKDVISTDSKFKMPKFKMPSFGGSAAVKSMETSAERNLDLSVPKVQVDMSMPSALDDLSIPSTSVDVDVKTGDVTVQLPKGQVPEPALSDVEVGGGLKGNLPKVKMSSFKMPKVDFKAPQVDIKAPKIDIKGPKADVSTPSTEVSLPSVDVDIGAPDATLKVVFGHGDEDMTTTDSKFKMPKFKMPSFGSLASGKSMEVSVEGNPDVSVPKVQVDMSMPSAKGDLSIQPPSVDVDVKTGNMTMELPEGQAPEAALPDIKVGGGLKGYLPKVKTPSFKMPKVDFKAPQVDIKAPKIDVKDANADVSTPSAEVSLPSVDFDLQVPDATLEVDIGHGDKDVTSRDSKFKMPKFRMPSLSGSAASKSMETSVESDLDVSVPKVQVDVSMPSALGDLSIQPPSVDVDVKTGDMTVQLPKGQVPEPALSDVEVGGGLKGHLPKLKTSSFKMPKVDFKAPQMDIKAPTIDVPGSKIDVLGLKTTMSTPSMEVMLSSVDVDLNSRDVTLDADMALGDNDVVTCDSKFKMSKFKMPSFGVLGIGKPMETSVHGDLDVSLPKEQVDMSMPSSQGNLKTEYFRTHPPSLDVDITTGHVAMQLPEGQVPEADLLDVEVGGGIKAHLPKAKTHSFKMPKADFNAPELDIKAPKIDVKGPRAVVCPSRIEGEISTTPKSMLEGDLALGDKESGVRDSKFSFPNVRFGFRRLSSPKVVTSLSDTECDFTTDSAMVSSEETEPKVSACYVSSDAEYDAGSCEGKTDKRKFRKPHFKMPKLFSSSEKAQRASLTVQEDSGMSSAKDLAGPIVDPSPEISGPGVVPLSASAIVPQFQSDASFSVASETGTLIKCQMGLPSSSESQVLLLDTSKGVSGGVSYVMPEAALQPPVACHPEPTVPFSSISYGPVTFPKFHRPKFQYSDPRMATGKEAYHTLGAPAVSGPCSAQGLDSSQSTETDPEHSGTYSECTGTEVPSRTEETLAAVVGGTSTEGADCGGKSSPLKMPRLKLPSFRWSPKKGVPKHHLEDVKLNVAVDTERLPGVPQVHSAPEDGPPEEDGEGSKLGEPGPVLPELTLPMSEASQASSSLPSGEPHPTLSSTPATKSGIKDAGTTGQHSLSLGSSESHGDGEVSGRQPFGKPVTPTTEILLPSSCRPEDAEVSINEGAASRDSWFRVPTFRLPGLRRTSSKEKGDAAGLEKVPRPDASSPREEAPARAINQGLFGEVAVPLHSPKSSEGKAAPNTASYADVLRRHLHSTGPGSGQHPLPARPSSPVGACPGEDHPLLLTRVSFSEVPDPEGEAAKRLLTLAAPSTHCPAPTSLGGMGIVCEDSVLKVRFPKLKMPRFTFPAPSPGNNVFIPTVREVWHPKNHLHLILQAESPEIWDATILKEGTGHCREQLKDGDHSLEVPPISKVRVHIQGGQAESHTVTIHSRPLADSAGHWGPEAFTAETVHEMETPASQTASYGFSLLKGRIPEPTIQTCVHLNAQDTPRPLVLSTDSQEPFEVIPSDREPTAAFEVGSGTQYANSYSDEEPAEILEFPPEESPGAALAENGPPKEKPESKRSSGLFRFWFPNIGFSPSAPEEPSATSRAQAEQVGPVQKQPEARPESGLPGKQEKAGWFRFPKLGFSSPPTENCPATEDEASQAEQNVQEEIITFFDARETFSPGEEEEELIHDAEAAGMSASSARTK